jgi:hypothetical protein
VKAQKSAKVIKAADPVAKCSLRDVEIQRFQDAHVV